MPERENSDYIVELVEKGFSEDINVNFFIGDSKIRVPELFKKNRNLIIDLVLVDGDHRKKGVRSDLNNLVGRFKVLILHDISHHHFIFQEETEYKHMEQTLKNYCIKNNYPYFIAGKERFGTAVIFNIG